MKSFPWSPSFFKVKNGSNNEYCECRGNLRRAAIVGSAACLGTYLGWKSLSTVLSIDATMTFLGFITGGFIGTGLHMFSLGIMKVPLSRSE